MKRSPKKIISAALMIFFGLNSFELGSSLFAAEISATDSSPHISYPLSLGKSSVYRLKEPANRVSVGDPNIADVKLINNKEIYILGKKTGSTNISIWQDGAKISVLDVAVGADTSSLRNLLADLFPGENSFRISAAGDSLVFSGRITDALGVQQVVKIEIGRAHV